MNTIAIVPARGGSKRIPGKNKREFLGEPAISRTLRVLKSAGFVNQVYVSTDDSEIETLILQEFSSESILKRPTYLADDFTNTSKVIVHTLNQIKTLPRFVDVNFDDLLVFCVYPVNPFLRADEMARGIQLKKNNPTVPFVSTVGSYSYPIQRALSMDSLGKLTMINPEAIHTRSQDLSEMFHDAGQWYLGSAANWLSEIPILSNSLGLEIPRWRVLDIDTPEDWVHAEMLFKANSHDSSW